MEEVGGAAADGFIVGGADFVRAPKGIGEVDWCVDEKEFIVEVGFDFLEGPRAFAGSDAFGPNEKADSVAGFETMLRGEGEGFFARFHVGNGGGGAIGFGDVKADNEAAIGVGAHELVAAAHGFVEPLDVFGFEHAIAKTGFNAFLEIRHHDFLSLFAGQDAEVRDNFTVVGDGNFSSGVLREDGAPFFADVAHRNGLHGRQYVGQFELRQLFIRVAPNWRGGPTARLGWRGSSGGGDMYRSCAATEPAEGATTRHHWLFGWNNSAAGGNAAWVMLFFGCMQAMNSSRRVEVLLELARARRAPNGWRCFCAWPRMAKGARQTVKVTASSFGK